MPPEIFAVLMAIASTLSGFVYLEGSKEAYHANQPLACTALAVVAFSNMGCALCTIFYAIGYTP
jgi:hypothetical protein